MTEEPDAGKPHVRICMGDREQSLISCYGFLAGDLPIRYEPKYVEYFANRKKSRKMAALRDRRHMKSSSFQKLAA